VPRRKASENAFGRAAGRSALLRSQRPESREATRKLLSSSCLAPSRRDDVFKHSVLVPSSLLWIKR